MSHHTSPIADKNPKILEKHGDQRIDNYYWMCERDNPKVLDYLHAENIYNDIMTADSKDFREKLFQEMKARIKENDYSVPYKYHDYWYITQYKQGKDYPIYIRRRENINALDEVMFDCNEMAALESFFTMGGISISPDNRYAAFSTDTIGRRIYTIQIKDLQNGQILPDKIENTTGSITWANDNRTLFYTQRNPETLRSEKIFRHLLNDNTSDVLVYEEVDETYNAYITKTKSEKYLVIGSNSTLTTEYQVLDANYPERTFHTIQPRIKGLEYHINHYEDAFYILTNADGADNFKLMKTSENKTEKKYWTELIAHREDTLLEDIDIFKDYLVVNERYGGLNKLRIIPWNEKNDYYLPFDNETYTAYTAKNIEFDTSVLRYGYSSLTTPSSIIDFDMRTKVKIIRKETEVLGGVFDKDNYISERLWAKARDGSKIPISIVYHKELKKNRDNPLLLYSYGSYGHTIDPYFSSVRLSLLDRGFVFAIAHVRGGQYLGRAWYEDGKLLHKKNTFTDFIDCTRHLIDQGYTSPAHSYAAGGSAGGLLMGAVINEAPELYNGILCNVPFVDVVTTMLDDSIPLTTGEYDEWGDPNNEEYYNYMKSYSPYDNIQSQDYPNMLVITGYHDSQVQYWEPAKWVAKLREMKTDKHLLLFHTNMDAGHSGASGRFDSLKEVAEEYAFLLKLEDLQK